MKKQKTIKVKTLVDAVESGFKKTSVCLPRRDRARTIVKEGVKPFVTKLFDELQAAIEEDLKTAEKCAEEYQEDRLMGEVDGIKDVLVTVKLLRAKRKV